MSKSLATGAWERPARTVERLLTAFERGDLLSPVSEAPNLVDLSRALACLNGVKRLRRTARSRVLVELIGQPDHLVFVLADGLGMNLVDKLPSSSFIPNHLALEMRSVFPSTTAVALTSLATGEWPLRHGITGWWTHLSEIENAAAVLSFVTRSNGKSMRTLGITAQQAFPVPSWMQQTKRDSLSLFPNDLASTVYSTYFAGGGASYGYSGLHEAVDVILARVQRSAWPTYTYLYCADVDAAVHLHGTGHQEVKRVLEGLDLEMARLEEGLGARGKLVLTADHGFLDIPAAGRHSLKFSDPLMDMLRFPPSGDARAMYFHVKEGAEDRFCEAMSERLGERFLVLRVSEALRLGLFGPGTALPAARDRLGDTLAVSLGGDVIEYRENNGPGRLVLHAAHHSGLSPDEMRIPLVLSGGHTA